jgi:nitrile hydratase subunit beta
MEVVFVVGPGPWRSARRAVILRSVAYANDVGGMHGFGDLPEAHDGPGFESVWEAQIFALNQACVAAGVYTLDEFRHAMERIPPGEYYAMPYYERWLTAVERLLP